MIERIKESIKAWAQNIHDEAYRENTDGRDEISEDEFFYNAGQMDIADSIMAQLDSWFKDV